MPPRASWMRSNARFRDHTLKLFEKHGMTNVGYFVPTGENPENKLVYLLSFASKEARDKAFKAFGDDPEWKTARAESEKNGKLVNRLTSQFLTPTDYSPSTISPAKGERVFELRTYTASIPPGWNQQPYRSRCPLPRSHHEALRKARHDQHRILAPSAGCEGGQGHPHLLAAHPSEEAGKKAFEDFRKDPDWVKARTASEEKAGGWLTEQKGGVVSEYLKPTDYSPLK